MNKIIALSSAIVVTTLSSFSYAGADCTEYPKSQWMSVLDLQKRIVNEYGFSIKNFKVDDECYEIYGWQTDEDGKEQKIEVYFDASNGDIVKKKMK
ncbi:PepSY domain-containing protein [Luminiphilus sp.]|jgi:hypothetical protein|nr:PepSY domain-containing protein [Luminiphilus sp.]